MNIDAMKAHIERLLAELHARRQPDDDFAVSWTDDEDEAHAVRDLGGEVMELFLPSIRTAEDYATALHELGHMCGRYQNSKNQVTRERWAWHWARQQAQTWTAAMEEHEIAALNAARINKEERQ